MTVFGQVLTVAGALVLLLAAVGLLRFGDVYMRASAVATATGGGITLVLVGSFLVSPGVADGLMVLLAVGLQLVTSAVGGVLLARSAVQTGHRFRPDTASTALAGPARNGDDPC
ncbi:cation:proton antiporter [Pseudonocardia alni]|uniref:Multicomponent Na+:H+ antiporter subunit G n=1 Tax=Pseudonocardia alni TaxID=33907 RepID=A0AA44UNC2_PSEA5|nr:monovalent cation/H(+) antiporter subunit G [Pseudonocardia alni]PKB30376.1 multicomponent Na+:H+ antiporter subunit G [Pseudonocardia alni]